jgi:hypothetical protein
MLSFCDGVPYSSIDTKLISLSRALMGRRYKYVKHQQGEMRVAERENDVGAYEFNSGAPNPPEGLTVTIALLPAFSTP